MHARPAPRAAPRVPMRERRHAEGWREESQTRRQPLHAVEEPQPLCIAGLESRPLLFIPIDEGGSGGAAAEEQLGTGLDSGDATPAAAGEASNASAAGATGESSRKAHSDAEDRKDKATRTEGRRQRRATTAKDEGIHNSDVVVIKKSNNL